MLMRCTPQSKSWRKGSKGASKLMANPFIAFLQRPIKRRAAARALRITTPDGIDERTFLTIGGIPQWVTIRGHDRRRPVVVIIHGGPGSPYTTFNPWLNEWEQHFVVVQWDQRGGGKTLVRNGQQPEPALSLDLLARDGGELVEQLCTRLGATSVLLVGSSLGSLIGAMIAQQHPELIRAFIAANQYGINSRQVSYALTRQTLSAQGATKQLRELEAIGADPADWTPETGEQLDKIAIAATRDAPNMVYDLMLPALLFSPDYTMSDIRAIDAGMKASRDQLFAEYADFDFSRLSRQFAMPYYIVQGAADLVSPPSAARAWFDQITAPHKEFHTIPRAGHLVEFAKPHAFCTILQKAQAQTANTAQTLVSYQ